MLTVTVSPAGAGNVKVNGSLKTSFPYETSCSAAVTLEAVPGSDYVFSNWSGDMTGSENPVTLSMNTAKFVVVNFKLKVTPISLSTAKSMLNSDKDVIVVDVRTEAEFGTGHILCALNYIWPETEESGRDGKLYNDYEVLLPYQNYDIIVYGADGTRSAAAAQFLAEKGFTHIFDMTDGSDEWIAHGYQTVTGNAECSLPPMAYAGPDQSVADSSSVTLDGSGSSVPGGAIVSYLWTQTGGSETINLSDPMSPTPTFTAPDVGIDGDTLLFNLEVTSDSSVTDTDSVEVHVNWFNDPPTAFAGQDKTVTQGTTVTLIGTGSSDSDGTINSYKWRVTSGHNIVPSDIVLSDDTSAFPVFTAPAKNGDVTFSLTVTDNEGGTATDNVTITVQGSGGNAPPVADAGPDHIVVQESLVALDGSGSTDPDDGIATYFWVQMDGPAVTLSDPYVQTPTFIAPTVDGGGAILTFALIISDVSGLQSADLITIQAIAGYTHEQLDQAVTQERLRWDANGDNRLGIEEAVLSMQTAAGIRMQADGLAVTFSGTVSQVDGVGVFRHVASGTVPMQTLEYSQEDFEQAVLQERQRWDVNDDNRMGIEEAIRALQILSCLGE